MVVLPSNDCRVTVQRLFSKFCQFCWNVEILLFDSQPTVAWPPTTVAWPCSDFFQNFSELLKTSKKVVWKSAEGRVTSDDCRVTVQRLFRKISDLLETSKECCLTVGRRSHDLRRLSRDRAATFQNFANLVGNVKKPCLTVGRRSRDLRRLSRDRSATIFKILPFQLKRRNTVLWQSADGRVTDDCRVTVQRLFCKIFLICLERRIKFVWQSADGRVTSHCRVTNQRLFLKNFLICLKRREKLFDSRSTVAWPPTTVAWPFSDFFEKISDLLETWKTCCLTVGRRSSELRRLSRDRSATIFKILSF